jgi:hypothetical protein
METVVNNNNSSVFYPEHQLEVYYKPHSMNIANPLLRELACVFGGFPSFTTYNIGEKQMMIFFFAQTIESQLDLLR